MTFKDPMPHCQVHDPASSTNHLTPIVCWTRIQADAGEDIGAIIWRKELERRTGEGLFFWGVGNSPSRSIKGLATQHENVDVVFSLMKSRPKRQDVNPTGILVWETYFDLDGNEQPIPDHVLVTSRMHSPLRSKRAHYALMCWTDRELSLGSLRAFDPAAYRNIGEGGGPIGSSQVTALVIRTDIENLESAYQVDFRAKLTGSYWVKLGRPSILDASSYQSLKAFSARKDEITHRDWLTMVSKIRFDLSSK